MAKQYLIDSNAISDYLGNKYPLPGVQFMNSVVDAIPNISVISKIEVLSFLAPPESSQLLIDFINDCRLFELTPDVVEKTIAIRRKHKIKVPDAIIAATAIVCAFTLITHNLSDFRNIQGLQIIDPHKL